MLENDPRYAFQDWPLNYHKNFQISCSAESATYENRGPEPKNRLLLCSQVCSSAETQVRWFTFRYRVLETRHRVKTKVTPAKAAIVACTPPRVEAVGRPL